MVKTVRTQEEINRQIEGLEIEKKSLPRHSFFCDDNWAQINAMLSVLRKEKNAEDYIDKDINIYSSACDAETWLLDKGESDLYSEPLDKEENLF